MNTPAELAALVEQRMCRPGTALAIGSLIARGWPGERILPTAGASRVYVAIATLRGLGLRSLISKNRDGYLLEPAVPLIIAMPDGDPRLDASRGCAP